MEGAGASSEALRYAEYTGAATGAGKGQAEPERGLVSALRGRHWGGGHDRDGLCPHRGAWASLLLNACKYTLVSVRLTLRV